MRTCSFFQETRCFGARNIFGTGVLPKIFINSTELLYSPGQCRYLPVSTFRMKKNTILYSKENRKIGESLPEHIILQGGSEYVLLIKM